jgi:hypothetical protein
VLAMLRNCESVNVNKPRRSTVIGLAMFTRTNLQISSVNNFFVNVLLGRSSSSTSEEYVGLFVGNKKPSLMSHRGKNISRS